MTRQTRFPAVLVLAIAVAVLADGSAGIAQSAPPGPDVVHIDVSVRDAAGQPIRGLTAADFEVADGGQPAVIAGVTAVDLPPAPPALVVPASAQAAAHSPFWSRTVPSDVVRNDAPDDRLIAIVIDDVRLDADGSEPWVARGGLDIAREIVNRLGPDDRAAVFFTFMGRQQGFTSDRARLLAAIDAFVLRTITPADCHAGGALSGCAADALQRVAEALPPQPRSRTVVALISGAIGVPVVGDGSSERLLRTLQDANATVYTFGSPAATPGGADHFATATGGRAVVDTIPPAAQVASMLDEVSSYYRIALKPAAGDGRFRPVVVSTGRPGAEVHARAGYFAPGAPSPVEAAITMTPLERALVASTPATGLPLGASVAAFGTPGRREAVVTIVTNVTSQPAPGAGGWQAEVAATAFDREWRPMASHRQTIEVTVRPGTTGAQAVDVASAIELVPGRYEIRVAAESGGRAGSTFLDVDVPEFTTAVLSASGIVVTTAPVPHAAVPLLGETLPVTPTSRRVFASTETPEVFMRFYQGGRSRLKNMTVSLSIADATGEGLIQGTETILPSQFSGARSTDWRFSLPVDRLAPGEYLLTVEAVIEDHRQSRQVRFAVAR